MKKWKHQSPDGHIYKTSELSAIKKIMKDKHKKR